MIEKLPSELQLCFFLAPPSVVFRFQGSVGFITLSYSSEQV